MPDQSLTCVRDSRRSSGSPCWICPGSGRRCCGCTQVNGYRLISQAQSVPVVAAESKEHEAELIPTVQKLLVPAALFSGDAKKRFS